MLSIARARAESTPQHSCPQLDVDRALVTSTAFLISTGCFVLPEITLHALDVQGGEHERTTARETQCSSTASGFGTAARRVEFAIAPVDGRRGATVAAVASRCVPTHSAQIARGRGSAGNSARCVHACQLD